MGMGKNINDVIAQKNMTIKGTARKAGVSYSTLYAIIKRDNDTVKPDILKKLATALEVPTSTLSGNSIFIDTTPADCEINRILAKAENHESLSRAESVLLQEHLQQGIKTFSNTLEKNLGTLQERFLLAPFDQLSADNKSKVIAYANGLLEIQLAEDAIQKK